MRGKRLILRLSITLGLALAVLGLFPTPSLALSASGLTISGVSPSPCTVTVNYTRTPTVDDGGGNDDFRVAITDSTGYTDGSSDFQAPLQNGTLTVTRSMFIAIPAKSSTSLTAKLYDQTSYQQGQLNGTLLATSPAFAIGSAVCTSSALVAVSAAPQSNYPPDNRALAYIRVNTPIYTLPNLKAQTVGTLTAGQTWFVSVQDPTGQFWEVFLGGPNLGWIKASDIIVYGQPTGSTSSGTGTSAGGSDSTSTGTTVRPGVQTVPKGTIIGLIITSHLHIHATGSILSPSIATANAGERYTILGRLAGKTWVKITGPAGTGWANSFYMILSAPLRDVPVIPDGS